MIFHFSVSRIHLYKSLRGKPHCLIRKPREARIATLQGREEVSINNEMCLCWRRTCQVKQEWLCNIQAMFALPVPVSRAGETSETWCSHRWRGGPRVSPGAAPVSSSPAHPLPWKPYWPYSYYLFWDMVSLCSPSRPQTQIPPPSSSQMLRLQACITMPSF